MVDDGEAVDAGGLVEGGLGGVDAVRVERVGVRVEHVVAAVLAVDVDAGAVGGAAAAAGRGAAAAAGRLEDLLELDSGGGVGVDVGGLAETAVGAERVVADEDDDEKKVVIKM